MVMEIGGLISKMRSRIKENFSQEDMDFLRRLINSPLFTDTNEKADAILYRFKDKGFIELAPATNRFALLKGKYVYKFALDRYGIDDNINEFKMSEELQPYVTKTYETNGYITIAEYVNLISEAEFVRSIPHIRSILKFWLRIICSLILARLQRTSLISDFAMTILSLF